MIAKGDLEIGIPYKYENEIVFVVGIDSEIILLDDGSEIKEKIFLSKASFLGDEDNILDTNDEEIPHIEIKYDKNGIPILPTEDNNSLEAETNLIKPDKNIKQQPKKQNIQSNPISLIWDRAIKQESKINIIISIDVVDKKLFDVIKTSFTDDDIDSMILNVIDSIPIDSIKKSLIDSLKNHYNL